LDESPTFPARAALPVAEGWLALGIALMAGLTAYLRLPDDLRDTLWAEDGALFVPDVAFQRAGLLTPYAGYLHLSSRASAQLAVALAPMEYLATAVNGMACALNGVVAGVVFFCSRAVFTSLTPRLFVAASTVLLPLLPVEVAGNLANLHGYWLWCAFWVLLYVPATRLQAGALSMCMLVATLSEVQTIVLLPIALFLVYQRRTAMSRLVLLAYALGVAAELWAMQHSERPSPERAFPPLLAVIQLYGSQVAMPLWIVSTARIAALLEAHDYAIGFVAVLPLLLSLALVLVYGDSRARLLAVLSAGLSFSLFFIAHAMNYGRCLADAECIGSIRLLNRYAPIPELFALVVVALLLQVALARRSWVLRVPAGLVALPFAISAGVNFEVEENRRYATHAWRPQVRGARTECRENPQQEEVCLNISPRRRSTCLPCTAFRKKKRAP
jgi:hypothetical protein